MAAVYNMHVDNLGLEYILCPSSVTFPRRPEQRISGKETQ